MGWVKLDDAFPHHPKVVRAGDQAAWLYIAGLCYSAQYLTDGVIPKPAVATLTRQRKTQDLAKALVREGLWVDADDHFVIHDYAKYNPSATQVKLQREADAERKNSGRNGSRVRPESARNPAVPSPSRPSELLESSSETHVGEPPPDDDDRGSETTNHEPRPPDRLAEVWALIADAELRERQAIDVVARRGVVADLGGWLAGARRRAAARHADAGAKLAAEHPDWPAHRIAAELEGSLFANDPAAARRHALETARNFGAMRAGLVDADDIDVEFSRQFGDDAELCGAALAGWQRANDRLTPEELRT